MLSELLNIIAPVFIIAGIGFALEQKGIGFHGETLSRLAMFIGTPCLLFSSLTKTDLPGQAILGMGGIAVTAMVITALLALLLLLALGLPWRTFLPPMSVPNAGNAGLPLVFFAFGQSGLTLAVAYFIAVSVVQYTVVPVLVSGDMSLRKLLGQPLVWSLAAVALFRITGAPIPTILAETTDLLSGLMIPVMLLLLGGAMSRLKIQDARTSVLLAAARLVFATLVGLGMVALFGLEGTKAGTVFLLTAMPSALITYVIAAHYNQEPERVAGLVASSTIVSFACLPALITLAIWLSAL
ncbi:MAG: AEC family transporter [Pseudomonadota bacterium]